MVDPHRLATGTQIEAPSRRFYFAASGDAFDLQCDHPRVLRIICRLLKLESAQQSLQRYIYIYPFSLNRLCQRQ